MTESSQEREPSVDQSGALLTGVQAPDGITERRYRWLAATVLAPDYGDNARREIGWRVLEFSAPLAYGPSLDEAIDAAMAQEEQRKLARSRRVVAPHSHVSEQDDK